MVRRILLHVSDEDFKKLKKLKGNLSWEKFLVEKRLEMEEG